MVRTEGSPSPIDLSCSLLDSNETFTTVKPRSHDVAFHGKNANPSVKGNGRHESMFVKGACAWVEHSFILTRKKGAKNEYFSG